MPNRTNYECAKAGNCDQQVSAPPESFIRQVQPVAHLVGMACVVLVWSYNTFCLKETALDLKATVGQFRQECFTYSDNNRHRVEDKLEPMLNDIKDQLNYLRTLLKGKI